MQKLKLIRKRIRLVLIPSKRSKESVKLLNMKRLFQNMFHLNNSLMMSSLKLGI